MTIFSVGTYMSLRLPGRGRVCTARDLDQAARRSDTLFSRFQTYWLLLELRLS